jgi:hypothetical protein
LKKIINKTRFLKTSIKNSFLIKNTIIIIFSKKIILKKNKNSSYLELFVIFKYYLKKFPIISFKTISVLKLNSNFNLKKTIIKIHNFENNEINYEFFIKLIGYNEIIKINRNLENYFKEEFLGLEIKFNQNLKLNIVEDITLILKNINNGEEEIKNLI